MTRDEAVDTARGAAGKFGKKFVVYRFPAWPPEVYGCIGFGPLDKGLPPGTPTFEVLEPSTLKAPDKAQGSLF